MIDPEIQKEITTQMEQMEVTLREKLLADFSGVLHNHNGFGSNKIKIEDLDTIFYKQATINPASLVDGAGETIQVTDVVGATLGDFVLVSAPYDLQDITVTAYVQANDVVEIRLQNESTATVDLASGIWRIIVIRKII